MHSIRAVLFDADGVIQNASRNDLPAGLKRIFGFVPDPLDAFLQEVIDAARPALAGQVELVQALEPVVSKWGAAGTAAALAEAWWCTIDADSTVLALIGRLRQQGIICGLATNQHRFRADYMRATFAYDSVFDHSFYSYQLGCAKPDVRYFQTILASLSLAPAQVLFIDDLETNVEAARSVGLQAAQFVHPRSAEAAVALRALLEAFSVVLPD